MLRLTSVVAYRGIHQASARNDRTRSSAPGSPNCCVRRIILFPPHSGDSCFARFFFRFLEEEHRRHSQHRKPAARHDCMGPRLDTDFQGARGLVRKAASVHPPNNVLDNWLPIFPFGVATVPRPRPVRVHRYRDRLGGWGEQRRMRERHENARKDRECMPGTGSGDQNCVTR